LVLGRQQIFQHESSMRFVQANGFVSMERCLNVQVLKGYQ
jgi:hypothetical protein